MSGPFDSDNTDRWGPNNLIQIKDEPISVAYDGNMTNIGRLWGWEDMGLSNWMPRLNQALCTGCGDCIAACPEQALGWRRGKAALVASDRCTYCTVCEDICPVGAIELPFLICKAQDLAGDYHRREDFNR